MPTVSIYDAKTQLSKLLREVARGEEVVIARYGKPVARLVPYEEGPERRRVGGRYEGVIEVPDDFDQTPDELLETFERWP